MNELVRILKKEIRVVEYKEQRVVTFEMIDELDGKHDGSMEQCMKEKQEKKYVSEEFLDKIFKIIVRYVPITDDNALLTLDQLCQIDNKYKVELKKITKDL
ncbi:MAG: hypothetical protein HQK78_03195 [Desulfobacterales bacterium]|nr:hypothetical protein [Desulfobacterales bacterium]